jgi:hypothetical protein
MVAGSPGTPASSTTKTGRHDIAESGLNTKKSIMFLFHCLKYKLSI